MPKYLNEQTGLLDSPSYKEKITNRGQKEAVLRRSVDFGKLKDVELGIADEIIWKYGDTLHKLSVKYYKDSKYYWVIGLVNNKPTDGHYKLGDTVIIPSEPELIDSLVGER